MTRDGKDCAGKAAHQSTSHRRMSFSLSSDPALSCAADSYSETCPKASCTCSQEVNHARCALGNRVISVEGFSTCLDVEDEPARSESRSMISDIGQEEHISREQGKGFGHVESRHDPQGFSA